MLLLTSADVSAIYQSANPPSVMLLLTSADVSVMTLARSPTLDTFVMDIICRIKPLTPVATIYIARLGTTSAKASQISCNVN